MRQLQTQNNVDLWVLANQISLEFKIPLFSDKNSQKKDLEHQAYMIIENMVGIEILTLTRDYSDNAMDFERILVLHSSKPHEITKVEYHNSSINYLKDTFKDINGTENEFFKAIKIDYNETVGYKLPGIHYEKRVANDQRILNEILSYAAFRWSGSKVSA